MSKIYADAVWRIRALLDRVEAWLLSHPEEKSMTLSRLQQEIGGPDSGYDQLALALHALADIGIIEGRRGGRINAIRLEETMGLRQGIRLGIDQATASSTPSPIRLLAALPKGLSLHVERAMQREADDLQAALVNLLASAQNHLLIASPFWDDETVAHLSNILERRLQAGVHIDLLGRSFPGQGEREQSFAHIAQRLKGYSGCRVFIWYKALAEDLFGAQTFHLKCIVADSGEQAYLGSANLTKASLRSRMELGVLLSGEQAQKVSRLVSSVLSLAERWEG